MSRKQVGMIDAALIDRVDAARVSLGQTRRVYVERALEAALGTGQQDDHAAACTVAVSPSSALASPRTPARTLEAGPGGSSSAEQAEARATRSPAQPRTPTKQELDMARQELMNAAKARGRK